MKRISLIIAMTLMAVLVSCKKDTVFVEDSNCIVVNGEPIEYNMIYVEGGQFEMGCEDSESHCFEGQKTPIFIMDGKTEKPFARCFAPLGQEKRFQ